LKERTRSPLVAIMTAIHPIILTFEWRKKMAKMGVITT
jgi:hypothetical protein